MTTSTPHRHIKKRLMKTVGAHTPCSGGYMQDRELYFYIKDYQGNVRAVLNQANQPVELNSYYPYGGLMAATATEGTQPYKYSGKELDRENGLNLYDSQARHYDPILPRTTTIDPKSETYYPISPYTWCAANPIRYLDLTGMKYGDTLQTKDAAAIDFGLCYNGKSITENREYITNIYSFLTQKGGYGFSYTKPQQGTSDKATNPLEPDNGESVVARAHTHAAYSPIFVNNKFSGETNDAEGNKHSSEGDIFVYNLNEVDGYVATQMALYENMITNQVKLR